MKQVINIARGPDQDRRLAHSRARGQVIASGSNPRDWKAPVYGLQYEGADDGFMLARSKSGVNRGENTAGIVENVGVDVIKSKKGDRVAAFHEMTYPGGSSDHSSSTSVNIF
ncbi:hypothetical protein E4T43_08515 [Aureobasidium subglaciale]|nr:hypothetical protein E4T43_08515 [Aureobasidium subglaciale]